MGLLIITNMSPGYQTLTFAVSLHQRILPEEQNILALSSNAHLRIDQAFHPKTTRYNGTQSLLLTSDRQITIQNSQA